MSIGAISSDENRTSSAPAKQILLLALILLSVSRLMTPDIAGRLFNYAQPALFGELAIMLWLLAKGANLPL